MWRWWIFGGLVVMGLGVVTMVVASYSVGSGPVPCADRFAGEHASEEFHRLFSTHFDVEFGETVQLKMTMQNTQDHKQSLVAGPVPPVRFEVATHDCRVVWRFPVSFLLTSFRFDFTPHEAKVLGGGEWSLTDHWGELVSPGYYHVYGVMNVDGEPSDTVEDPDAWLVVSRPVWVSKAWLRAVRLGDPPSPAYACSGGIAHEVYIRQVMEKHSELLREWKRWSHEVLAADILDENRMSTGRRGIRVVDWIPAESLKLEESSARGDLPECLEGVPVQVVMKPEA